MAGLGWPFLGAILRTVEDILSMSFAFACFRISFDQLRPEMEGGEGEGGEKMARREESKKVGCWFVLRA